MKSVLITDGNQRKSLAAARTLGKAGWRVLVAEDTAWQLTRFSRYVARALTSPPAADQQRYRAWLLETLARERVVAAVGRALTAPTIGPLLAPSWSIF